MTEVRHIPIPATETLLVFDPDMKGGEPAKVINLQDILDGKFGDEDEETG